ncbi:MAG: hypothetical protein ACRC1H_09915 [Caldilineaceae bacterium]
MTLQGTPEGGERFRRSVVQAQMADLLGMISGRNRDLVSYEEVARRVKAYQQIEQGTQMIPLGQIVGSVGRYRDFNKEFLPRSNISKDRWTRVDSVLHSMEGYPPIEVYRIGEVYFVRDGNHRVSVARANGLSHIEAYVTEVQTNVPLTQDDFDRDDWLVKIEHTDFLHKTRLDELRPGHNMRITEPGRYTILLRHIFVHQYLRNQDLDREGSSDRLDWFGAVESWYDTVYAPICNAIRNDGLLDQFPNRTEADLYLWITHHREELASLYGLAPLSPEAAVSTFAKMYDDRLLQRAYKAMKYTFLRVRGALGIPMGMSDAEFGEARARWEAGERTLLEREQETEQLADEAARLDEEQALANRSDAERADAQQADADQANLDRTERAADLQRTVFDWSAQ